MGLPVKLPISARPIQTANIFTGTFNVPTVNRYDFTNVAGNQNQTVLVMTGASIYIIERVNFSMSIPEGVFQEGIDSTVSVPRLIIKTAKTDKMIFDRPLPFINFVDNLELLLFVPSDQSQDEILVTFEAVLSQVPAMGAVATIQAFLQLNVYEVQSTDWVTRFYYSPDRAHGPRMAGTKEGTYS